MTDLKPLVSDFFTPEEKEEYNKLELRLKAIREFECGFGFMVRKARTLERHAIPDFIRQTAVRLVKNSEFIPTELKVSLSKDNVVVNDLTDVSGINPQYTINIINDELQKYLSDGFSVNQRMNGIVKLAETRRLEKVYPCTGYLKYDYPCISETLTPDEARRNGWVPKGYELIPIEFLDFLIDVADTDSFGRDEELRSQEEGLAIMEARTSWGKNNAD